MGQNNIILLPGLDVYERIRTSALRNDLSAPRSLGDIKVFFSNPALCGFSDMFDCRKKTRIILIIDGLDDHLLRLGRFNFSLFPLPYFFFQ